MKRDSNTSELKIIVGGSMAESFRNLDMLVEECGAFMSDVKSIPQSPGSDSGIGVFKGTAAQKFRAWRSRKRDEKLLMVYNSLLPRIKDGEEYLRDLIIQIVEKKIALRDQARHLKIRLDSCIKHNCDFVDKHGTVIEHMRSTVNNLSTESSLVKAMVAFNAELVRQKVAQNIRHGRSFVSWGSRAVLLRPISEQELSEDADHPVLMNRLYSLRECREQLVVRLANMLEVRESHLQNYENCSRTSISLIELLKVAGEDGQHSVQHAEMFDHENCHDCSYVQTMTVECHRHLSELTQQIADASQRLILLVELREKVRESGEFLRDEDTTPVDDLSHYTSTYLSTPTKMSTASPEGTGDSSATHTADISPSPFPSKSTQNGASSPTASERPLSGSFTNIFSRNSGTQSAPTNMDNISVSVDSSGEDQRDPVAISSS